LVRSVVTAPIIGSTSLDKLKELIGKSPRASRSFSLFALATPEGLIISHTDVVDVKLSEEEIKHLEEPYKPMPVIGHA
jgi:hypothetical protein